MQPSAISAVKNFSSQAWQIELQCPQCGAPLVLEETDRILSCSFCRVRLYLAQEGQVRYYLKPRGKLLDNVLFVPYWRFKGMVFSVDEHGVAERLVDSNLLALRSQCFPFSLGVRPQVLRLQFIAPGAGGKFLSPAFPFQGYQVNREGVPGFPGNWAGGRAAVARTFIGETVSLIYSPFLVTDEMVVDAILDRPVPPCPEAPPSDLPADQEAASKIKFIPMLCPECGCDLEGEKNALVLLCRNCESAWQAAGSQLENLDFGFIAGTDDGPLYLPFWRIRAGVSGVKLKSYADLIRLANLPRAIQSQWEEQPAAFWVPAFKIQPQLFLRLAKMFTVSQSSREPLKGIPRSPLHAATLPLSEAVESIKVLIASLAVRKDLVPTKLSEAVITPDECSLVYIPFVRKGSEIIHPGMQTSISANALEWGKLL
jgi:hypothetical protein